VAVKFVGLMAILVCVAMAQNNATYDAPQKRVSADAYKSAPAKIRAALKEKHCELPSARSMDHTPLNIVSGHFAAPGQTDWAAICILPDNTTRAFIFWGQAGPPPCPTEISSGWALTTKMPHGEAGSLYLLRQVKAQILEYRKFFGDPNTAPVDHDGVEVGGDQASLIYYCYKGKWLELQGAD
jgi:hypothetical protein